MANFQDSRIPAKLSCRTIPFQVTPRRALAKPKRRFEACKLQRFRPGRQARFARAISAPAPVTPHPLFGVFTDPALEQGMDRRRGGNDIRFAVFGLWYRHRLDLEDEMNAVRADD